MPGGAVLPDLTGLPLWAQIIVYCIFGFSVSIPVILTMFGYKNGQKNIPNPGSAQVAAVIVDPTALNLHTSAVKELSDDVRDLTRVISALTLELAHGPARCR